MNNIVLAKNYIELLDEVYRSASVTADLTSDPSLIRQGANVNELIYPQIDVTGLGDYDRNSGYTNGAVNVQWKTATFNYDRGTKISVDTMDNQETFDIAFGAVGAALQREKVAPEADAFVFATLAGIEGISIGTPATFDSAEAFLAELLAAKNTMDEDEVPEEGRILYATPTLLNSVMALDTTKSREVLNAFSIKKKVPQSRFYTAIDLLDGETVNEIYASRLGDPKNWECFMGIATDSWAASVGSQGAFTGAASLGGQPIFYKADMRHKVWISSTGAHQIASQPCQGVKAGCGGSVAVMDEAVIYKSASGFCMDNGSTTVEIGQCFAGGKFSDAVGGVCGHKYYVSMCDEGGAWHLFVYDAQRGLWYRQDNVHARCLCSGTILYAADENAIWDMTGEIQNAGYMEETVPWMAETGEIGLENPDRQYISRLDLRLSMEVGAELTVYAQYDKEPEWVALGSIRGTSLQTFSLPLRLRRCDHFRLRFEGGGDIRIYSITKTIVKGSDRR